MTDFAAYDSRWRLAWLLLGSLGFVTVGAFILGLFGEVPRLSTSTRQRIPPELVPYVGWLCVVFFSCSAIAVGMRLIVCKAQLVISANGLTSFQWSDDLIPWSEITKVTAWNFAGQNSIVLHLKDPSRFASRNLAGRFSFITQKMVGGDVVISLIGTDKSFDEAMAAIDRFRSKFAGRTQIRTSL